MVFASCLGVVLASIVVMFVFFAAVGAAVQGAMKSLGGGSKPELSVPKESVLLLDLKGSLSDKTVDNPFAQIESLYGTDPDDQARRQYTLPEVLKAIDLARTDSRVNAIVLRLDDLSMGYAAAHELRNALQSFSDSGKLVVAYCGDRINYGTYYVSTVADKVYASPETNLPIKGLASTTVFQKGLLAKLGIEMQVFKVGTYKGAVEPYMLDHLSPENRMQIQSFLDGLWQSTIKEMAESRGVEPEVYQSFADRALFLSPVDSAMNMGLVDSLVYDTDIQSVFARAIYGEDAEESDMTVIRAENLLATAKRGSGSQVAVIYAEGNIVEYSGEDNNPLAKTESQIDNRLAKRLKEVAEDDDIKAVVLRVNSPGGSARASELIAREVVELKKLKPIVVSMGNYAASGGYYISSNASAIVAEPFTLTGSIGIFGIFPNATDAARKLAITHDVVKTSEMADLGSLLRPMRAEERTVMQRMIEQGYDKFLSRVSEGRGMTKAQVDLVGQGRVWLGQQAVEKGLVDKLGGLQVAIDEAARLAELDDYRVVEIGDKKTFLQTLFGTGVHSVMRYLRLTDQEKILHRAARFVSDYTGIMARPDFSLEEVNMGGAYADMLPMLKR